MQREGTTIGHYNTGFDNGVPLVLDADTRRRHMYVCGASGVGKSTLLYNIAVQDIEAGSGFALLDPHGDLAEAVIDQIPPHRTNHVCYLCPSDSDYPVAFNVLEDVAPEYRAVAADGMVLAFKSVWSESWGPRLEHILRHALTSLIEYPTGTLLMLPRLLNDARFRQRIVDHVSDPVVTCPS